MPLLFGWRGWRAFRKLPWDRRNIVIYSESGQDWHQFSPLIEYLNGSLQRPVCYVTSDGTDPGLARRNPLFTAILIPEGIFLTIFFQMNRSDLFVLTMMDLGNMHLKRSIHPVHYVYIFHSMGSTHMVDHADSFDHYDTLFVAGPHQAAEIRRREELKGLPAKHLFDFGHPRLEHVMEDGRRWRAGRQGGTMLEPRNIPEHPVVLIAPTWGDTSIFNVCGVPLIDELLQAGFYVIMRPHYHTNRLTPHVTAAIRQRFADHPRVDYVDRMGETESLFRSDVLISDWSAMALEYSLGLEKPVLFIDVPRRIRNPDWQELGIEPIESAIREQVGRVLSPAQLEQAPAAVLDLLKGTGDFGARMRELRERTVYRLGHSAADGAAELARLADLQRQARLERAAADG